MEIIYMNKMKDNPVINNFKNRPFSIDEIVELEVKYNNGNPFQIAFREFLFLGGEFNNVGFDDIDGIEELQEYAKEDLKAVNMEVERPFFAFDVYDSQYSIFFLDEENENPDVFLLDPFGASEEGLPIIKPNGFNFKDLVNESIRRVKNNIAF